MVDLDSQAGDSGGPVYLKNDANSDFLTLYGTHIHSGLDEDPNAKSWFSPVNRGLGTLNSLHGVTLVPCMVASC